MIVVSSSSPKRELEIKHVYGEMDVSPKDNFADQM